MTPPPSHRTEILPPVSRLAPPGAVWLAALHAPIISPPPSATTPRSRSRRPIPSDLRPSAVRIQITSLQGSELRGEAYALRANRANPPPARSPSPHSSVTR